MRLASVAIALVLATDALSAPIPSSGDGRMTEPLPQASSDPPQRRAFTLNPLSLLKGSKSYEKLPISTPATTTATATTSEAELELTPLNPKSRPFGSSSSFHVGESSGSHGEIEEFEDVPLHGPTPLSNVRARGSHRGDEASSGTAHELEAGPAPQVKQTPAARRKELLQRYTLPVLGLLITGGAGAYVLEKDLCFRRNCDRPKGRSATAPAPAPAPVPAPVHAPLGSKH